VTVDRSGNTDADGDATPGVEANGNVDPDPDDRVELGVALLEHLEDGELTVKEAIDRLETVTTDPHLTREILDTAELRGVIEREEGIVRPTGGTYVRFQHDVVRRDGEFTCLRCGAGLSTGHFIRFEAGEHGPFGSSCIRKVTGRED
jgi:hypothetical protein